MSSVDILQIGMCAPKEKRRWSLKTYDNKQDLNGSGQKVLLKKTASAVRIELERCWGKREAVEYLDYSRWVPGVQEMKKHRITDET